MSTAWCGVDLSKDSFHACLVHDEPLEHSKSLPNKEFPNNPQGLEFFLEWLLALLTQRGLGWDHVRVVMESTGKLSMAFGNFLCDHAPSTQPAIVNPYLTKAFHRSLNFRQKTDKADACSLALYGREREPKAFLFGSPEHQELRECFRLQHELIRQRTANLLRLSSLDFPAAQQAVEVIVTTLDNEIDRLDSRINFLCKKTEKVANDLKLLRTLPGVGPKASVAVLAELGDLRRFTRSRQVAAFAGLSPEIQQSGTSVNRSRLSKRGNPQLRGILYMAAMAASRNRDSPLGQSYHQMINRGKPGKVALVALARKMLVIMRAMLINNQPYDEELLRPKEDKAAA